MVSGPTVSDIAELRKVVEEAKSFDVETVELGPDTFLALLDRVEAAERAREMHEFSDGEAQEWRYVWRELEDWAAQLRRKEER